MAKKINQKSVKIGAIEYRVKETDIACDNYGTLDYSKSMITLREGMPQTTRLIVLMHEILHGIFYNGGIQHQDHNEVLIDMVAHGIIQVLKDNPELVKEITQKN